MAAIYLIAGLTGALLVAGLLARGGLLAGCLLVLLAGSCFGHPFFSLPAWPMPVTADRLLLLALVGHYAICRWRGSAEPKPWRPVDGLLVGLVGWGVVSTFTHDWRVNNHQPVADIVFQWLMPAAMYWVARQAPISRRQVAWLLGGLAIFGLYLAVTAVCEVQGWRSFVFPQYIADAQKYREYFGRGRGPYLNPAPNGVVMSVCLCAAMLWWPRLGRGGRLVLLAVVPAYLAGLGCTLTRSVWMGGAAAAFVCLGLNLPSVWRWRLAAAGGLLALLAVGTQWDRLWQFKRDRDVTAYEMAESAQLRPILAVVAWNMFCDRPLAGCGYGQYSRQMIYYLHDRSGELPLEKARRYVQHNTFLGLLTELGLIGLLLFAAVLMLLARDAWRLWRFPTAPTWARQVGLLFLRLLAAYVVNSMFHNLILTPMVTMLIAVLAGAVMSLGAKFSAPPQMA